MTPDPTQEAMAAVEEALHSIGADPNNPALRHKYLHDAAFHAAVKRIAGVELRLSDAERRAAEATTEYHRMGDIAAQQGGRLREADAALRWVYLLGGGDTYMDMHGRLCYCPRQGKPGFHSTACDEVNKRVLAYRALQATDDTQGDDSLRQIVEEARSLEQDCERQREGQPKPDCCWPCECKSLCDAVRALTPEDAQSEETDR